MGRNLDNLDSTSIFQVDSMYIWLGSLSNISKGLNKEGMFESAYFYSIHLHNCWHISYKWYPKTMIAKGCKMYSL